MTTLAFSAGHMMLNYSYWANHKIVLSIVGKKLRTVFDVTTRLESTDSATKKMVRTIDFVVRVEEGGAVIVVEDGDGASCPSALGRYSGLPLHAKRLRFLEQVCASRGRYVFKNGRFVAAR